MIASIYLNDKNRVYSDVWEKAHEALNMFTNLQDKEGKAETNFMLAMIIRKKPHRITKTDSLHLKRQARSDLISETQYERLPKISKASSSLRSLKEDEKNYLKVAMQAFVELKHQYGIARVSLAMAIRNLDSEHSKQITDEIEKNLLAAIKGFELFRDYQNLTSCYLKLGELKLQLEQYNESKKYAEKANEI